MLLLVLLLLLPLFITMERLTLLTVIIFACLSPFFLKAQKQPGLRDSLYSEVLQEQRVIYVNLPEDYNPDSEEKWDVIFVTDGEWNTESTHFIHGFARYENFIPHAIIVGIPNTYIEGANQRNRDFLPVHKEQSPGSGKADQFLEFLRKELIPYINKKYRAGENRTLIGHSFGGVFAMYALLSKPDLFENYIATDPPFHWNNDFLIGLAAEKLPALAGSGKVLWISGIESSAQVMDILRMDSVLQKHSPAGFYHKLENFPNETHNSVRLKGVYDGLKFAYDGYSGGKIEFHPMNGIVIKDKPFNIWLNGDPAGMHYTTDGSTPTAASEKMETLISLSGPANLQLKKITRKEKWDKTQSGSFKEGTLLPETVKPKKAKAGGFSYAYYEGDPAKLIDLKDLKPVKTGIYTKDFDLLKLPRQENFGLVLHGFLEITDEGYYLFGLDSGGGTKLSLGNHLLISNDGSNGSGQVQSYIVPLKKGFYPFRFEYIKKDADGGFQLFYITPNDPEQVPVPVPAERQYSLNSFSAIYP